MAITLTFTRGTYVHPVAAQPATDDAPAVEAVPGGRHLTSHSLNTGTGSASGQLWLEGIAENASDDEIAAAIKALYGLSD